MTSVEAATWSTTDLGRQQENLGNKGFRQMIRTREPNACGASFSTVLWLSTALFTTAAFTTAALAQAPTDAQRAAIKSQCRSDYMAHCSSVPPGGAASLQCLEKNMSSLSSGCADAVRAVQPPAASKAEGAPKPESTSKSESTPKSEAPPAAATTTEAAPAAATAEPAPAKPDAAAVAKPAPAVAAKPGASGATRKPTQAQIAAIRSACRGDYPDVCAGVPTGGAAALQCLAKNRAKLSAPCGKAVAAISGGGASATATAAPAAGAAASTTAPAMVLRPMRPREELMVLRSACGADVRSLCGGVAPGGGRIAQCLASNAASLSPACRDVLSQFAAR
jgi:hypothetical protein